MNSLKHKLINQGCFLNQGQGRDDLCQLFKNLLPIMYTYMIHDMKN